MLYIIDKNNFNGCIEASMADDLRTDYSHLTLNEFREMKNNPNLITVTVGEFELMRDKYIQTLITPLKEIPEDSFYNIFKVQKINTGFIEKGFACFLFGEYNAFGIYDCYCEIHGKFYMGKKSKNITKNELEQEINGTVIVLEYNTATENIELYNYLQEHTISDISELFDQDTCKIRICGYDYPFICIRHGNITFIIYSDVEYDIERKELETILFLFFNNGFKEHFTKKYSTWSDYTEGCIAFKEWGQSTFAIWQYNGKLPQPK